MPTIISVSIVFALKQRPWLKQLNVPRGTSVAELVALSGLLSEVDEFANIDIEKLDVGVYSEKVNLDYLLKEGDRLEIYRPLLADPKEIRRQLALIGKTMGSR